MAYRRKEPAIFGTDLFGDVVNPSEGRLRQQFIVPPFSVLDSENAEWVARKTAWQSLGIKSEIGRNGQLHKNMDAVYGAKMGRDKETPSWVGSSIFDPVMCECAYRWWCPVDGQVVDPFAGGSVRGVVAASLGLRYWGSDLRFEQIEANREQARAIGVDPEPVWVCGDSREVLSNAPFADFIFSCPPYGDLEKYSDDPKDISGMDFRSFVGAYQDIIEKACQRLKEDRFACFVVADFRDKKTGNYRNFVGGTIRSFKKCGLELYNEGILVTSVGTAAVRARRQFDGGRKLIKLHQNILVFVKGDGKKAANVINRSLGIGEE